MPAIKYGHLADYATIGANGKPILVGVFDRILPATDARPIRIPPSYLFVALQCSIGEGETHEIVVQLRDGNGEPVGEPQRWDATVFRPAGPGYPLQANLMLILFGATVPEPGDYQFEVVANGIRIGEVAAFVVSSAPPTDTPSA